MFWCLCRYSSQPAAFNLPGKATGGLPHPSRLQHHQAQHNSCVSAPARWWTSHLCGRQQQQLSGGSCLFRHSTSMEALHIRAEGKCANAACPAYTRMVVDCKGMVSWSLIAGQAHCPMCSQQFVPITCAFTGCLWAFDGIKLDQCGKLQYCESEYQAVSGGKYHRFEENDNQVRWQMLVLCAKAVMKGGHESKPATSICPVCWEHPDSGNHTTTSCGHSFHQECLDAWKQARPSTDCPLCRTPL